MSLNAQIIDQQVTRAVQDHGEALARILERSSEDSRIRPAAFVLLVVQTLFDMAPESALDTLVDGGQDFGIDALHMNEESDSEFTVTLLQGKYRQKLDGAANFPENDVRKMIQAVGALFDPDYALHLNPRLAAPVEEARALIRQGLIPNVHVVLCNNGQEWTREAQALIDQAGFGDQVTWRHVGADALVALQRDTRPITHRLSLTGQTLVEDMSGFRRVVIGRLKLGELADLFETHGDRLLEKNIRRYLGLKGNRVNEAIQETLSTEQGRQNFYYYNNGLTAICTQFRTNQLQKENVQVQVEGLQIINGGQTSRTVQQVVAAHPEAASAEILLRLYELPSDDHDLVLNITQATNSQNPVDLRDLRSNDQRQQRLQLSIEGLGYTYGRQRGGNSADLTSSQVADAVLAVWRHRPHQARHRAGDHFGALYDLIFTEDLNGTQAVLATLILREADRRRRAAPPDAPPFLPYAHRFAAMVMGRFLLEAMNVPLAGLTHTHFTQARSLLAAQVEVWFQQALEDIEDGLTQLQPPGQAAPSLQWLSAQFRRVDLVEHLMARPFTGRVPPPAPSA